MKYAKRMILVPEIEHTSESLRRKAKQSTNKLAKSIRLKNQAKVKQWVINPAPPGVVPQTKSKIPTPAQLSANLPPLYRAKAERLLNEMLNVGFTWTSSKELILPSGERIVGSSVESILDEALVKGRSFTKPKGWEEFISEVSTSSFPTDLLTKRSTIEAIRERTQSGSWETL